MLAKILHITFAFLVLLSSTGITVKKHYCQNKLESVSFLPTSGCCKTAAHQACKKSAKDCKKGCCSNELEYIHLDQDFQVQKVKTFALDHLQITAVLPSIFENQSSSFFGITKYFDYESPPIFFNFSILFQVFRL